MDFVWLGVFVGAVIIIAICIRCCCWRSQKGRTETKYTIVPDYLPKKQWRQPEKRELNLHNYTVKDALDKLENQLSKMGREAKRRGLDLTLVAITGWGKHSSDGRPKIKPAVEDYLNERGYSYEEDYSNHGRINIDISSEGNFFNV